MEISKAMVTEFSRFWSEAQSRLTAKGASMSFEAVDVSLRTSNIFVKHIGKKAVGDVLRMTPREVIKVRGVGKLVLKDLQTGIAAFLDSDMNLGCGSDPESRLQDKIASVFKFYIADSPHFDVVRSEKVGYLFISIDANDGEFIDADVIPTAEQLCARLYDQVAYDVLFSLPNRPENLYSMTVEQKQMVRKRLDRYSEQLPEFAHLVDELFLPPEWKVK